MTSTIDDRYTALHPRSAELHEEAETFFPGGVTHDVRYFPPFGPYIDRAAGARKWDADGNEIIDYVMGHGALLLGHAHPSLVQAVQRQVERGTHYGASHDLEIRWARAVQALFPSAERVRFTASGTEATMMAVRLARAATGRTGLLKLRHHFHGWNDSVTAGGARMSAGLLSTAGLPPEWQATVTTVDQNDTDTIAAALDTGTIAAAICEPGGYHFGGGPLDPSVLELMRERTRATGTILIFDEVVTGFRASSGGFQERLGITPDLTTLAKVLAGGLPGGAVVGRADLIDQIAIREGDERNTGRVSHPGTFNANPLSAAAGVATLAEVATGEPVRIANERARRLAGDLNAAIRRAEVPGAVYGDASMLHIVLGRDVPPPIDDFTWNWDGAAPQATVPTTPAAVVWPFRRSLLNRGVDLIGMGALVSCVHTDTDIDATVDAFEGALADLRAAQIL